MTTEQLQEKLLAAGLEMQHAEFQHKLAQEKYYVIFQALLDKTVEATRKEVAK